jgi:GT2 family glycosyltransferase
MSFPTFSVVIPTYHRPQSLAACLESLAQQSYPAEKFEVIVVDDANAPRELEHLAATRYPFECRILSQTHGGAARARNAGAYAARGQLLAFTDDDCRPAVDWLTNLERRLLAAGEETLVGGRVVNELSDNPYASATQALIDFLYEELNSDPLRPELLTSNNFGVGARAFRAIGGFDPTFGGAGGEDRELCLRWAHSGRPLLYAPEVLVYHAHALTFLGFLRQHFAYGRGAAWLRRRALFHGYGPLPLGRASFYWDLLSYPQRRSNNTEFSSNRPGRGSNPAERSSNKTERALLTFLFVLSQIANTSGYLWVSARER